jgi:DNA-binding response OmpR family regulator
VDDDDLVRQTIARRLARAGWRVVQAADGASALEIVGGDVGRFAAVVLDLSMVGLEGRIVLERLAALDPDLPVVVLSGFVARPEDLSLAAAVLTKPDGLAELVPLLRAIGRGAARSA